MTDCNKTNKQGGHGLLVRNGGIQFGHRSDIADLKRRAEADPKSFTEVAHRAVFEDGLRWTSIGSVKDMQEALEGVRVTAFDAVSRRAIDSSAFPLLSGNLTVAGVNDAYMALPTIGEQLVTEVDDNKKTSVFSNVLSEVPTVGPNGVPEGKPFPLVGAGEERFDIGHLRDGRRMVVTQEMIEENDIAGIVQRVNALGLIAAETIEKLTLRRVCDVDGSGSSAAEPYVLRLNKTATSLYSSTANNPGTRAPSGTEITNNPLTTTTALESARSVLASMTNDRGQPISVDYGMLQLVVTDDLWLSAWKLINSTLEPGVFNEVNFFGDRGPIRPRILSSRFLDGFGGVDFWLLGNCPAQFVRKWKLRPETVVIPGTTEGGAQSFLDSRIGFQARVAWDCEVGARDYVHVVRNLPGNTQPS